MTKVKLTNGTIIDASYVELLYGALRITTREHTVEELAELFSNKENTSLITLMTESEKESGFKTGFTSFAGIIYDADGNKIVELFQPVDVTELRLASVEGTTGILSNEITDTQLALTELAEMVVGGM